MKDDWLTEKMSDDWEIICDMMCSLINVGVEMDMIFPSKLFVVLKELKNDG